jgi:peroxiredoxin
MNTKRKIAFGILAVSIVMLSYMGIKISLNIINKREIAERIKQLPDMTVYSLYKSQGMKLNEFISDKPLILVYFNTDCHFCQGEIKNLENNIEMLKDYNLVFISSQASGKIKHFYNTYQFSLYHNWRVVKDSMDNFKKIFGTKVYPNTYIYSKNGFLLKHFKGETDANAIFHVLD